jgi:hypothetical protein
MWWAPGLFLSTFTVAPAEIAARVAHSERQPKTYLEPEQGYISTRQSAAPAPHLGTQVPAGTWNLEPLVLVTLHTSCHMYPPPLSPAPPAHAGKQQHGGRPPQKRHKQKVLMFFVRNFLPLLWCTPYLRFEAAESHFPRSWAADVAESVVSRTVLWGYEIGFCLLLRTASAVFVHRQQLMVKQRRWPVPSSKSWPVGALCLPQHLIVFFA